MHQFATVISNLVHHHARLRINFEQLGRRAKLTYETWIKNAGACETNAVGMNCRNSLVKYANMLQVIEHGGASGPPA